MTDFTFIDTGARDGAWNMAFDVAHAEAVDAGRAGALLRVYRWNPWCVSLGRNQAEADVDPARLAAAGYGLVRRPTGGRAILHAEELTYAVIMPSEGRGVMEVYREISEALAAGLRLLAPAVDMARSQPNFQKLYREPGSIPCFSSSARYEIEVDGRKLVGSAQRRIGSAVLQHGSILIGAAHLGLADLLAVDEETRAQLRHDMEAHTLTLQDVLARPVRWEEVRDAVFQGFRDAWGMHFSIMDADEYISGTDSQARA